MINQSYIPTIYLVKPFLCHLKSFFQFYENLEFKVLHEILISQDLVKEFCFKFYLTLNVT